MTKRGRVGIRVVSTVGGSCSSRYDHCWVTVASLVTSDVFLFVVRWSSSQFEDLGLQLLTYYHYGCVLVLEGLQERRESVYVCVFCGLKQVLFQHKSQQYIKRSVNWIYS